ncbi:Undecaprenyl phosphate N,N'-diacetylbacillosamine 1-phosphate transferase [compost metagenome]
MSIVGPRPLLVEYLPLYDARQHLRHNVRPGMTGLAQINGRNRLGWEEKFEHDLHYVNNLSLALDLWIMAATIANLLLLRKSAGAGVDGSPFKGNGRC